MAQFLGVATRQAGVDRGWRARPARRLRLSAFARALLLYFAGGLALIAWTSGLGTLVDWRTWWAEPVVYQKLVCWTMLLEVLGLTSTWVPSCGVRPAVGAVRSWLRTGTIRIAPWPRKPKFADPDTRTLVDVALYVALVVALAVAVVLPGVPIADGRTVGGLVRPEVLFTVVVAVGLTWIRDKVVFLAARAELLLPPVVFSLLLGYTDLVVALKLTVVVVWFGTGLSQLGRRLAEWSGWRGRRLPVTDLIGTAFELVLPVTLLVATRPAVVLVATGLTLCFHGYAAARPRLGVPLELTLFTAFATVVLFVGHPAGEGFGIGDFSQPWMLPGCVLALATVPVMDHLRPHLVGFVPSARNAAGAATLWVMAPGVEQRLAQVRGVDPLPVMADPRPGRRDGSGDPGTYTPLAWHALHSQGHGLRAVLEQEFGAAIGPYTVREAGPLCSALIGMASGEQHLHDDALVAAIQARLAFEPGELTVIVADVPSVQRRTQQYRVVDAALGVLRRGRWEVADAVARGPWPADGRIPVPVSWSLPGQPTRMRIRQS